MQGAQSSRRVESPSLNGIRDVFSFGDEMLIAELVLPGELHVSRGLHKSSVLVVVLECLANSDSIMLGGGDRRVFICLASSRR